MKNYPSIAEILIEEGAFLTYVDDGGMTPLHHAAFQVNTSMVFLLLDSDHEQGGARDMRCRAGNTPLQWALQRKKRECAKLLDFGLDNSYMDDDDYLYW